MTALAALPDAGKHHVCRLIEWEAESTGKTLHLTGNFFPAPRQPDDNCPCTWYSPAPGRLGVGVVTMPAPLLPSGVLQRPPQYGRIPGLYRPPALAEIELSMVRFTLRNTHHHQS